MILTLTRDAAQHEPYCTVGVLTAGDRTFQTVELPWVEADDNVCGVIGKSCIGVGLYTLEPRHTEAKGDHWILSNPAIGVYRYPEEIPAGDYARSLVLIHAANWASELLGCIGPGKGRAYMDGKLGVTSSRMAMDGLRIILATEHNLQLEIK